MWAQLAVEVQLDGVLLAVLAVAELVVAVLVVAVLVVAELVQQGPPGWHTQVVVVVQS